MFCYCRLLRRVLLHNKRGNSSYLKFSCTNYVHSESLSINSSKNVQERNPSLLAVREVRTLEFFWRKQRNGKRFKSIIDDYFLNNEGSSSHVLDLLRAACYSSRCSSGLILSLLINLNDVINRKGEFSPSLDEKKEALQSALTYQSYDIIQEVCKAFKIVEHSHCFKEFINNLISEQKLIQACYCITALRLQHEFDIEKIFFPLLLEGKIHPVVMCIENHPDVQLRIVKKLDNLLGEENIGTINYKPSLNSRKIYKVLNKLMNILKIPSENYKYVHHIRSRGAINILIKRRSDQSVSEEAWKEMVMSIIGDDDQLKEYLIFKLMQQNDKETALEMVENLNMIDFDVTKYDLAIGEETEIDNAMDKEEFEDLSKQFEKENNSGHLMFPLSASDIKYTDNVEKFTEFIDDILKYNIAGIDTEWKPQFNLSPERLALMQIAIHDRVYILDLISLNDCLSEEHWDKLLDDFFGNPKIIKLGCGIMTDISLIVESNHGTKGKTKRFVHILDMALFFDKLQEIYPTEMNLITTKEKKNWGLSDLCEIILGQPLNKEERLCDWEKRPLTDSQLEYAALDAFCLVQMYDRLKQIALEKEMNFDHLATLSMHLTTSQWKPKRRFQGMRSEKGLDINKPLPIQHFKVVIDSTLEVQGKQLRQMGADVRILDSSDSPKTAVEISKSEERILICSLTLFRQVEHIHPEAFCFKPVNKYGDHTSISSIFHKFNVQLNSKSILSRCMVCNSPECIKLTIDDINFLQEYNKNKDPSILNCDTETSNFTKTLSDMIKSGKKIKFKNEHIPGYTGKFHAFLCTECGIVQ